MVRSERFKVMAPVLPGPGSCPGLGAVSEELIGYSQPSDGARCPFARTRLSVCVLGLRSVVERPTRCPSVPGSRLASPRPPAPSDRSPVFRLPPRLERFSLGGLQIQVLSAIAGLAWLGNLRLQPLQLILCQAEASARGRDAWSLILSPRTPSLQALPSICWTSSFWLRP